MQAEEHVFTTGRSWTAYDGKIRTEIDFDNFEMVLRHLRKESVQPYSHKFIVDDSLQDDLKYELSLCFDGPNKEAWQKVKQFALSMRPEWESEIQVAKKAYADAQQQLRKRSRLTREEQIVKLEKVVMHLRKMHLMSVVASSAKTPEKFLVLAFSHLLFLILIGSHIQN